MLFMKNIGFTHICRKMSRIRIARFLRKVIRFFLRYKESYTFYLHWSPCLSRSAHVSPVPVVWEANVWSYQLSKISVITGKFLVSRVMNSPPYSECSKYSNIWIYFCIFLTNNIHIHICSQNRLRIIFIFIFVVD